MKLCFAASILGTYYQCMIDFEGMHILNQLFSFYNDKLQKALKSRYSRFLLYQMVSVSFKIFHAIILHQCFSRDSKVILTTNFIITFDRVPKFRQPTLEHPTYTFASSSEINDRKKV